MLHRFPRTAGAEVENRRGTDAVLGLVTCTEKTGKRIVYFDAKTKLHLIKYLNARTDENPALFVSIRHPHDRLLSSGVELMLRKMGEQSNVNHVHPHKFRRTMATAAIDKGMPIEQVQRLLGHEKIDTTLHYSMVKQNNVKMSHKKYIG
jgi:site-specific recombinase XerD